MTPTLVLWPATLPRADAGWARRSSLVVAPGELTLRHGRRRQVVSVAGCRIQPAQVAGHGPGADAAAAVLVDGDGRVRCSLDLSQWHPAADAVDASVAVPWASDLRTLLAERLDVSHAGHEWPTPVEPSLDAISSRARTTYVALLLALAAGVAGPLVLGMQADRPDAAVVAGLFSLLLVAAVVVPWRRGPGDRHVAWRVGNRWRGPAVWALDQGHRLYVHDSESGRSGHLVVGPETIHLNGADIDGQDVALSVRGRHRVVSLGGWSDPHRADLRHRLDAIDGLSVRASHHQRWRGHVLRWSFPDVKPQDAVALGGLMVLFSGMAAFASWAAAALFAVAALGSIAGRFLLERTVST